MNRNFTMTLRLLLLSVAALLAGCERPPIEVVQHGHGRNLQPAHT